MGVFSERIFAVFLLASQWRRAETAREEDTGRAGARERNTPTPAWQTWDMQNPTTSSMRADLEALRTYTRIR